MCELLEIMQDTPATSVGLMLVSRLRRRPNIKPTRFFCSLGRFVNRQGSI